MKIRRTATKKSSNTSGSLIIKGPPNTTLQRMGTASNYESTDKFDIINFLEDFKKEHWAIFLQPIIFSGSQQFHLNIVRAPSSYTSYIWTQKTAYKKCN